MPSCFCAELGLALGKRWTSITGYIAHHREDRECHPDYLPVASNENLHSAQVCVICVPVAGCRMGIAENETRASRCCKHDIMPYSPSLI